MKKFFLILLKFVIFFVGWALIIGFTPDFNSSNKSIVRLWYEFVPFLVVIIFTCIFVFLVEKGKIKVHVFKYFKKNIVVGLLTGFFWIGSAVSIFLINGSIRIQERNNVDYLFVWVLSLLLNVIMQEFLIRGYLYQLFKRKYNIFFASIGSTLLFTLMHVGIVEAGGLPLFNLITMSLFMTVLLEYTRGLLAPILVHFIWNLVGGVVLGGVSLASDYPNIFNSTFQGDILLSGGEYKLEGSVVVLILNIILILCFLILNKKKRKFNKRKNR